MTTLSGRSSRANRGSSSSLHPPLGRMPAPVWTMVLWQLVGATLVGTSVLITGPQAVNVTARPWIAGYGLLSVLVLLMLRERTPTPLLRQLVLLNIVANSILVAAAVNDAGAIGNSIGYVSVSLYSAFWATRVRALIVVAACSIGYLIALIVSDRFEALIGSWVTTTVVCVGVSWVIAHLVDGLDRIALLDPLTGLMNRRGLNVMLALLPIHRESEARALIVIDLDDFKAVNDTQGHAAGDDLLQRFGESLRQGTRHDDVVARLGGDEFVIVLAGTHGRDVEQVLDRLRAASAIEWSAGAVDWPADESFDSAMSRADASLYASKRSARA